MASLAPLATPKEQKRGILELFGNPQMKTTLAEDTLNPDNLDLIVWDYVSYND